MGKTRDLFKKIRYTMGTVHAKMGTVKDRKMVTTYTEELYKKKVLMTRRECNILECEFKWILGSISTNKASVSDGIPAGLLKILKDDAVKVLHSMPANLENSAEATELEKVNFHSNPKEGQCQRMLKLPQICAYFTCLQGNAQKPSSWASTVHELRTSRCTNWF